MREIGPGAVNASGVIGPPAPFTNASAEAFLPVPLAILGRVVPRTDRAMDSPHRNPLLVR
eukprot:5994016-Alexandrium_andersonii.AAC.1